MSVDHTPPAPLTWRTYAGAAALIVLFLAQSAVLMFRQSFTWDETRYVGVGNYLVTHRPWTLDNAEQHPPLTYYLSSLGLIGTTVPDEIWENDNAVERGRAIILANGERIIPRARLPMLVLGALLGAALFAWSRQMFGARGAFLSLFLYSLSPNLMANQSLITPDFALTTFFFLTGWCLYRTVESGCAGWAVATGVAGGLALLSKFTALFLLPVAGLWLAGAIFFRGTKDVRRLVALLAIAAAVAAVVVLVAYQFQVRPLLSGIRFQFSVSRTPWAGYLLGEISKTGWPHYFLVAFLVKVPVPVLAMTVLSGVQFVRGWRRTDALASWFLLVPIAFFFVYLSFFNRLNIGFRYLLPVMPFLFVWLGQLARGGPAVVGWVRERTRSRAIRTADANDIHHRDAEDAEKSRDGKANCAAGRRMSILLSVLIVWQIVSVGRVFPHYLAYFNEIAGGPENGYRWLGDANLDWGQDLKGLKEYVEAHPEQPICVSYFGTMPMEVYGLRSCELTEDKAALLPGGYLALSVTKLQGMYLDDPNQYRWLWDKEPIPASWLGILRPYGYSIRIYRL